MALCKTHNKQLVIDGDRLVCPEPTCTYGYKYPVPVPAYSEMLNLYREAHAEINDLKANVKRLEQKVMALEKRP